MNRLNDFWRWFSENERVFRQKVVDGDLQFLDLEISPMVAAFTPKDGRPYIGWEIGKPPAGSNIWQFSFSPVVKENIPICATLVENALALPEWEIFPAKPQKPREKQQVTIFNSLGALVTISPSNLYYKLWADREMYIVDVWGHGMQNVGEDAFSQAVYHVIEAILGELELIDTFSQIKGITAEPDDFSRLNKMAVLPEHLRALRSRNQ